MISIVVVSHSRALAEAAIDLASQMMQGKGPRMVPAAGLDGDVLGTDASSIAAALEEVDGPDGTLVLLDLGSAVLSGEMALDFVDPDVASRVRLSSAPLVEGLVMAAVTAGSGASLDAVAAEADQALTGKQQHLAQQPRAPRVEVPQSPSTPIVETDQALQFTTVMRARHGLHARPSALVVTALAPFDAEVEFIAPSGDAGDAHSITQLQGLELGQGDILLVRASGPQAREALAAVQELADRDFGDAPDAPEPQQLAYLELDPDVEAYEPAGSPEEELLRFENALANADGFIEGLAAKMPEQGVTGAVLGAIRAMLHDPVIEKGCQARIGEGRTAMDAVQTTFEQTIAIFAEMENEYLRERATDLRSLERLLVKSLMDFELALPEIPTGQALVLDELDALTAAQIDPAQVPLVVVRAHGTTGHGIIIAQDRGLPVRLGASG